MSLNTTRIVRGAQPDDGEIIKTTLAEDNALVAFSVIAYTPEAETQYGTNADVTVDLLVVDGRLAGRRDRQWRAFGNLARQLGAQPVGETVVARITSGMGKVPGSRWYGADFDVDDNDLAVARTAIDEATNQNPAKPASRPATTGGGAARAPFNRAL